MDRWFRRSIRVVVLVGLIILMGAAAATVRLVKVQSAHAAMAPVSFRLNRDGTPHGARRLVTMPGQTVAAVDSGTPQPAPQPPPPPPETQPVPVWSYDDYMRPEPTPVPAAPSEPDHPAPKGERIPVLMYHEIGDVNNGLYVSRSDFEAEVKWLSENGFHTVTLGEVYHHVQDGKPLPAKPIVLSFDDGYQTFSDIVVPVLKPYGFRATAFIITGMVGHREFMTWDQVKALPAAGMEIGSHTVNHLDLRTLSPARLKQELTDSKKELEEKVGVKVDFFCYPAGRYNDGVVEAVKSAGYLAAVTTEYGPVTPDQSRLLWSRIRISRGESLKTFATQVNQASGL